MPFIEHSGRRVLLVHIPKTGGTSVARWMSTLAPIRFYQASIRPSHLLTTPQHLPYQQLEALFGAKYFDYAFALVRNPYERFASEYRYRAQSGSDGFIERPPFAAWLDHMLAAYRQNPFVMDNHLRPQWQFLGDRVEVFKYEDGIERAAKAVSEFLGVESPQALPRVYATDVAKTPVVWDALERGQIEELYARDFDQLGYSRMSAPAASRSSM